MFMVTNNDSILSQMRGEERSNNQVNKVSFLVDDPLVLLEGAPQHALPAVRAGHGDLGLDVHVHNPQVARQLRFAVEAALTELTVKPLQMGLISLESK